MATLTGNLTIEPVTPRHFPDLDLLFGAGDPKSCQCAYYRMTSRDYRMSDPAANRLVHQQVINEAATAGRAAGLIAHDEQGPVGWVSFGPRKDYARLSTSVVMEAVDDKPVWSVICFVVPPRARRQGVARALLAATVDYARDNGIGILEGYPVDSRGRKVSSAELFKGTLSMFEEAGFTVAATRQFNSTSPPRPIVRRTVRQRPSSAH